jgi:hypothetical protein
MVHPFSSIQYPCRWYLLTALFVITVALAGVLRCQGTPLQSASDVATRGILSYEFSWNESTARAILESWSKLTAVIQIQLKLDYIFLLFYPLLFSLACGMLADSTHNTVRATIGSVLSWVVLLTGPFDAIENYALLNMIEHGASETMAKIAGAFAGAKFLLLVIALAYILVEAALQIFEQRP